MPSIDDDPGFHKFIEDLEGLRDQSMHRAPPHLVARVLRRLPAVQKPTPAFGWKIFSWAGPFALGGAVASLGFLFFSPYAPFDIVRKQPTPPSKTTLEVRAVQPTENRAVVPGGDERIAAARLTRLMNDYQTASRWLADAGVTSPASKAQGLKVLTDLAATGFSESDWSLYRATLPTPRSIIELVQGAQCVYLWDQAGASPEAWRPVLQKAAELRRISDVLLVTQSVRAERIDPELLMASLNNGLTGDKNTANMLAEIRTAALPSDDLPQDAQQVRVEPNLPAADLPRAE